MTRQLWRLLVVIALAPTAAMAQGIRFTDHDLSFSGGKNVNPANNQICIYCHTPHKAQSTQMLWNHTQTVATNWNWGLDLDNAVLTATSTGTILPTTLKSGSKRCLGCHDGSVAIGDVSNVSNGNSGVISGLSSASFTDAAGHLSLQGKMMGVVTGTTGNMGGNHPISIPYGSGVNYNGQTSAVSSQDMGGALGGYYDMSTAGCTSPTGMCTTAPATDGRNGAAINLIPNVVGAKTAPGVECSTCHEPHNKYAPFRYFTRVDFENASGLCRSCHNK